MELAWAVRCSRLAQTPRYLLWMLPRVSWSNSMMLVRLQKAVHATGARRTARCLRWAARGRGRPNSRPKAPAPSDPRKIAPALWISGSSARGWAVHDFQMLRRDLDRPAPHSCSKVSQTMAAPKSRKGLLHDLAALQVGHLAARSPHRLPRASAMAGGEQHGGGQLVVLRLAQQVGGHDTWGWRSRRR